MTTLPECVVCRSADYTLRAVITGCDAHTLCYPCAYRATRRNNACPICRAEVTEVHAERVRDAVTEEERAEEAVGLGGDGATVIYLDAGWRDRVRAAERAFEERRANERAADK